MSDKNKLVSDAAEKFRDQVKTAKRQAKLEAVTFKKERETKLISEARLVYNTELELIYSGKSSPTMETKLVTPARQEPSVADMHSMSMDDIAAMMEPEDEEDHTDDLN